MSNPNQQRSAYEQRVSIEDFAKKLGEATLQPGANEVYRTPLPGPGDDIEKFQLFSA